MSLGVGIVGLPNVGKSTTFNALTKAQITHFARSSQTKLSCQCQTSVWANLPKS